MVHRVWGEALPHFPLYLVEALLVEATAAALLARRGPLVYGTVAGLLIGTVETTSHAVVNALSYLLQNPDLLAQARAAA